MAAALMMVGLTAAALPVLPVLRDDVATAAVGVAPNVVLITTDDQTTSDLRFMPFTRRYFAEHGTTFSDAVAPYPLCCPARATLLTGQLAHNHGVLTNHGAHGGYEAFVRSPSYESHIGHWLQNVGYRSMFVGKYLNHYHRRYGPPPGWDAWNAMVNTPAGGNVYDYYATALHQADDTVDVSHIGEYQSDVLSQVTRDFIDSQEAIDEQPFFVWESNLAPHGACRTAPTGCQWGPPQSEPPDGRRYTTLQLNRPRHGAFNERVVRDKPAHIRALPRWGSPRMATMTYTLRQRARSLRSVDRSVEATINRLTATGELENTLLIFTSDNGYLMGQHRARGKVLPYEASLQVPLLMAGPGVPAGARRTDTVALVDIAPTIAEAAGATPAVAPDGRSLLPVARNQADGYGTLSIEAGPQQSADWPTWFYRGVRTRRYTYVHYPRTGEYELYDRRHDPAQKTNLAYRPAYRRTRAALDTKLAMLRDCTGQACYQVSANGIPEPSPQPYLANRATVHPDELASIGQAGQVVTITARNWRTGRGRLTAWTRRGRTWTVQRGPLPVRLGGDGLAPQRQQQARAGQTPAGTFRPQRAFGLRPQPTNTTLRYHRVGRSDYWVQDPKIPRTYNINQPRRVPTARWRVRHAVRWAAYPGRFSRGLLMDYNLPRNVAHSTRYHELRAGVPADVRKGSFILHAGRRLGPHGWVSMRRRPLNRLLQWMRPRTQHTTFVVGTPSYLRQRL